MDYQEKDMKSRMIKAIIVGLASSLLICNVYANNSNYQACFTPQDNCTQLVVEYH